MRLKRYLIEGQFKTDTQYEKLAAFYVGTFAGAAEKKFLDSRPPRGAVGKGEEKELRVEVIKIIKKLLKKLGIK